ncbi:hypothetical protein F5144DRAFT_576919 [Chaetomium tenue]|uniref:Uncharacterized protein n=1 Tax=Chaetomium tenue TaxID=1854479 RepID=A0ACB7P753_9PEZI|nr:hypothetical protein F5144DRAFT_576919 [Chaetomium globosum]
MGLVAGAVNEVVGERLREGVRRRFWDVLVSGEMDVERAAIAAAWWGTKGGREAVLFGSAVGGVPHQQQQREQQQPQEEMYMMSGALGADGRDSKL